MQLQTQPVEATLYSLSDALPEPAERRGDNRLMTLFRLGAVVVEDRRELCLIKNISAGGMLIRAYCPIAVGATLSVELKRGEMIRGSVTWASDGNLGVTFDTPVDVIALLAPVPDSLRPRLPRIEVQCTATVRQGATAFAVRTRDVSQGGLKVESDRILQVGDEVIVTLPGLAARHGVISWAAAGCFGINFSNMMALAELVAWLHEQREEMRAA
ncbi:PilZ domain-containing protein [Sphingomonas sp.]|uniref:PilZ domain-containing protein n=1 Tax=Sphingomonas sp. TaxID=28214 RepID=UPI00286DB338|nr:PilZ domain-containing protein [Sphingomonas sp.]